MVAMSPVKQTNPVQHSDQPTTSKPVKWLGRTCNVVKGASLEVIRALVLARDNTVSFSRMFRLFAYGALGLGHLTGRTNFFTALDAKTNNADGLIDATYSFGDPQYFFGGGFKKDNCANRIGRISLLGANIGGLMMWLNEVKIVSLAKIGEKMARTPVLRLVAKVSLLTAVRATVGVAFTCFAFDAGRRLVQNDRTQVERIDALWGLTHSISEVSLKVVALTGCVNPVTLATLGIIAASLGIGSFLYNSYHKGDIQAAVNARKIVQNSQSKK